jgi:arabinofuranan 3-O-arabinosyltransferase
MTPSFLRRVALIWVVAAAAAYAFDLLQQTAEGLTNGHGRPLGDDFVNFWSGAYLAWHGRAADVYDWPLYHAFQQSIVGPALDPYNYSYPPILLLASAPLALLPYAPGLAAWLAGSWLCFYRALRLAWPGKDALLLSAATPAVFVNAIGGQNGAWTAALLGGGLTLLDRAPVAAGVLFGLMTYKPQLGLLIPVALVAGRRWRALAGASATAVALLGLSVAVFGADVWRDDLEHVAALRTMAIEDGTGVWHRTISVFMLVRRFGADVPLAYVIQTIAAVGAAAAVTWLWLRDAPAPVRNAALVLGTFLATPYVQDYDMVVGAFLVVWLAEAVALGLLSQRQSHIAAALVLAVPIVASPVAKVTGLALGCLFLVPAFVLMAWAPAERRLAGAAVPR